MAHLTRKGAKSVTADLDRLADLVQHRFEVLGLPEKVAQDFAHKCDLLADHIEQHAIHLAGEAPEEEDVEVEEEVVAKKAARKSKRSGEEAEEPVAAPAKKTKKSEVPTPAPMPGKKAPKKSAAAKNETGESVEPGPANQGFDANQIGDTQSGPLEILPPVESWMSPFFSQKWFAQLRDKQQKGDIGFFVSASMARLRKLASVVGLSDVLDTLKVVHARLDASTISEVKALAAAVKRQVAVLNDLVDANLKAQATGDFDPGLLTAIEIVQNAVAEQLPYLQEVVSGTNVTSPIALLEMQRATGGLKDLVEMGAKVVEDAVKSLSPKKETDKTAGDDSEEDEAESDEQAGDESEDEEESDDTAGADSEEDEAESDDAASDFGYRLFD